MSSLITLLVVSITGVSLWVALVLYILFFPEKIEIISSWFWLGLSKIKKFAGFAHKQYVKHDLQGRLNDYMRKVKGQAPYLAGSRFKVEYTEQNLTKKGFFDNDQVILRVRRDDPQETNFVHVAYWAVATGLLFKTKRYISPSQGEAVDLYFTTRLFEEEKPSVVNVFLDNYLHPKMANPKAKVARYYDDYARIDHGGYFYSVFLQELDYLGDKVFGGRKDDQIIKEVNALIPHSVFEVCRTAEDRRRGNGSVPRGPLLSCRYRDSWQGAESYPRGQRLCELREEGSHTKGR